MVLWSVIDKNVIDSAPWGKEGRVKFSYEGGPLRFQIPRSPCTWGVSQYKSMNLEVRRPEFLEWWRDLEKLLCPQEPFKSNLGSSLRLKIDETTYIFDENSKQVCPEVREGLFRGQELSCLVDIESTYFFNGTWGLTCKAVQVRFYPGEAEEPKPDAAIFLPKGRCAFLEESDA